MEVNPLSIILVKSDSKGGDRLLFRYPTHRDYQADYKESKRRKNPYAVVFTEDILQNVTPSNNLSDQVLSNLFAVKPELCDQKFELKVNDVRFVGHPIQFATGIPEGGSQNIDTPNTILINIVFALHAHASHSIVKCYYDLSKRLGIALRHEERRCCYVTGQSRDMIAVHDEIAQRQETGKPTNESPYDLILQRCSLARDLRKVYEDLSCSGLVQIQVNKWIEVSFCLPHKVHQMSYLKKGFVIEPETVEFCLKTIRPYHGILLLVDSNELLERLPPDSSPALSRLIQVYSPVKSLQTLASDSDLSLSHVYQLVGHLVYWAKAMMIYPVCKSNIYCVAPAASTKHSSPLVEKFAEKFSGRSLIQEMSEFSLPTSLNQRLSPLVPTADQQTLLQIIAWMLQHRLILQLHTYVTFMPETTDQPPISTGPEAKKLLADFYPTEQAAILQVRASSNIEDLTLFCKLHKKGYFSGKHHLEDIMYFENLRRSQLLCVLDKFREILIFCEMEDSAISLFYPHSKGS